ncbi:hypothetical protein SGFS_031400 [Streptomyces graminofaciens]|uniref:HTH luxR-type domain-containing protein n=1 Tax=Streptomyces graminofaciens TaxID=68212 RepID=A0ABN5VFK4_9ACTN|nr:response regulator transcription factor [Streptomyces graminofaciens]BBC31846.1 hypothetical protein SGFS_031400 [Streptomyces graminofaciens]
MIPPSTVYSAPLRPSHTTTLSVALVRHGCAGPFACEGFHSRIVREPWEIRPSDDVVLFHGPRMGAELRRFSDEANGGLPPLAVLATCFDRDDVCLALDSGAVGYLLETDDPDLLTAALQCVSHGHTILAPQIAAEHPKATARARGSWLPTPRAQKADTIKGGDRTGGRSSPLALSRQEREIMARLASGVSVRETAVEMRLAEKTVRNYLSNVYGKLGVHSQSQALLRWLGHADGTSPPS